MRLKQEGRGVPGIIEATSDSNRLNSLLKGSAFSREREGKRYQG